MLAAIVLRPRGPFGLRYLWQQVLEVTFPPRRIFADAIPARPSSIEDSFYPAADTRCCLWPRRPDRLNSLHDEAGIDSRDWQAAEDRIGIGRECRRPLRGVLCVPP